MREKIGVFAFPNEDIEELKERFHYLENERGIVVEYHSLSISYLQDIMELTENHGYGHVFISSIKNFYSLDELFLFIDIVRSINAEYYFDQEKINSRQMYYAHSLIFELMDAF